MVEEPVESPVDSLVKLINELHPFLDTGGLAYVYLLNEVRERRLALRMDDRRVRFLLLALYREKHQQLATWDQIYKAMALVQGRLLKDLKGPKPDTNDPTVQVFLKAVSEHEGWAGAAHEVLILLRETQKAHKIAKNTHLLPGNSTAIGIWLSTNQLPLLAYGIELYRPTRRSTKRLWAWRRVMLHSDASDTSETPASLPASAVKPKEVSTNPTNDTCDTCSEDPRDNLDEYLKNAMS